MRLTREALLRVAHKCVSEEQMASMMGWKDDIEKFVERLMDLIPGYEDILFRNEAYQLMKEKCWRGLHQEALEARLEYLKYTDRVVLNGLSIVPALGSPPRKKEKIMAKKAIAVEAVKEELGQKVVEQKKPLTQRGKAEQEFPNLPLVSPTELKQAVLHGQVVDTGRQYLGRRLVVVRLKQGLFGGQGTPKGMCFEKDIYKYYTLTNGWINQCDITQDGVPTPYWATMQAMIELETWTEKSQVVKHAVGIMKADVSSAISTAYNVLKTHAYHPCKSNAGMGFMVEQVAGEEGKTLKLRARQEQETVEQLFEFREKVTAAKKNDEVPIVTHVVTTPH